MSHWPKISIITPSFNQGQYIEETICSILDQNYPNLEYIIIDGGSSDNSVEIIKKYEDKIAFWVSEKDKGQSDAINKGISKMTGDVFNWINSDDILKKDSLITVAQHFKDQKTICLKGGLEHIYPDKQYEFDKSHEKAQQIMYWLDPVINQQSTFYDADFVKSVNGVNGTLHYAMDYELWIKFLVCKGVDTLQTTRNVLGGFRLHEEAKTSMGDNYFRKDIANILMSLAESIGHSKVYNLLNIGYKRNEHYNFGELDQTIEPILLEQMAIYFVIKWSKFPENKLEYNMLKYLKNNFDRSTYKGTDENWNIFLNNFSLKSRIKNIVKK